MRIGIDARMYSSRFTGIGRYAYELICNLSQIDQKNDYFIFLPRTEFEKFNDSRANITKVLADIPYYSFKEQILYPRLLAKYKLDIIHFTHFNAPIFFKGPSIIVTIHDLTLSFFPGKKMTSFLYRWAYRLVLGNIVRRATQIIAVSKNTKNDLIKYFKVPASKITVIYEGVNPEFKVLKDLNVKEKYNISNQFLLYTGVWRDHKNLRGLIKSFNLLLNDKKVNYDLVITGKDDPAYHEIKEEINVLGLQKKIHLVGLVPEIDLIRLYNSATLYVFPSFYEGFGLPPLEAMACGTVVVASNTSCIPEICGVQNAVFFDPYSINDMAEKIFKVLTDIELRKRLIQNGFKRIKKFSWVNMSQTTYNLYKNIYDKNFKITTSGNKKTEA